jgi:hypothetical protein
MPHHTNSSNKKGKKKVTFSDDTLRNFGDDNIALTISKHQLRKEYGYTEYFIQVINRYMFI